MIFAANKLYNDSRLENPSIFFIVDRIGLEEQLFQEISALDIIYPESIASADDLGNVIRHDNYRGKRGMFITLIHKFHPRELDQLRKELEQVSRDNNDSILTRRNVMPLLMKGIDLSMGCWQQK
jgi:type I restriction enzyme, R subunit